MASIAFRYTYTLLETDLANCARKDSSGVVSANGLESALYALKGAEIKYRAEKDRVATADDGTETITPVSTSKGSFSLDGGSSIADPSYGATITVAASFSDGYADSASIAKPGYRSVRLSFSAGSSNARVDCSAIQAEDPIPFRCDCGEPSLSCEPKESEIYQGAEYPTPTLKAVYGDTGYEEDVTSACSAIGKPSDTKTAGEYAIVYAYEDALGYKCAFEYELTVKALSMTVDATGAKTEFHWSSACPSATSDGIVVKVNGEEISDYSVSGLPPYGSVGRFHVTVGATANGVALSATYDVVCDELAPDSIEIFGSDSNEYFDSDSSAFSAPTFAFYFDCNDDDFDSLSPYAIYISDLPCSGGNYTHSYGGTSIELVVSFWQSGSKLIEGETPVDASKQIEMRAELVDEGESKGSVSASFSPRTKADYADSIVSYESLTMPAGNSFAAYFAKSALNLKVRMESGIEKEGYTGFSYPSSSVELNVGGATQTISYGNGKTAEIAFSVSEASFKSARLDTSACKTSLTNNADKLDLRDMEMEIRFQYSDVVYYAYYSESCAAFKNSSRAYKTTFSLSSSNASITAFDGTETCSLASPSSGVSQTFEVTATATALGSTATAKATISVYEVTEVAALTIVGNPYDDYRVGDSFLSDEDDTKIGVYYKTSDGYGHFEMLLRDAFQTISVYPVKGTKFASRGAKTVKVQSIFDPTKSVSYDLSVYYKEEVLPDTEYASFRFVKLAEDATFVTPKGSVSLTAGTYVKVEGKHTEVSGGVRSLIGGKSLRLDYASDDGVRVYGYLKNVVSVDEAKAIEAEGGTVPSSVLVNFYDFIQPVAGDSNSTVTFPCYDPEASSFVDGCTIGARFGHNNSLNRLFLSGNADKPNFDIHSCEPNYQDGEGETEGDYSYLPDEAMCKYGGSDNAVVGYDVVSDSKLIVLKNRFGSNRTIYFRSPYMTTMLDSSGNAMKDVDGNSLYQEEYQVTMSNSPMGAVSARSIANFNGDTVFVDQDNEVAGLDVEGIIGDSQRQASTRSFRIDRAIKGEDLSSATLHASGRYLYLDAPSALYVADRDSKGDSGYEWWPEDPLNATAYLDGDSLVYGDADGGLWIEGDSFFDSRDFLVHATISAGSDSASVSIADGLSSLSDIDEGLDAYARFRSEGQMRYEVCFEVSDSDSAKRLDSTHIAVSGDVAAKIGEGNRYYWNAYKGYGSVQTESLRAGTAYRLVLDGEIEGSFAYEVYEDGGSEPVELKDGLKGEFCRKMDGEYKVVWDDKENSKCHFANDDGSTVDVAYYHGEPGDSVSGVTLILSERKPVASYAVTAPLLASSMNYYKNILKIDLSNETGEPNSLSAGYRSNRLPAGEEFGTDRGGSFDASQSYGKPIDFSDFEWSNIDFSKNSMPRCYTIPRIFKRTKFVCLAFNSTEAANSILPSVALTYTAPKLSGGQE